MKEMLGMLNLALSYCWFAFASVASLVKYDENDVINVVWRPPAVGNQFPVAGEYTCVRHVSSPDDCGMRRITVESLLRGRMTVVVNRIGEVIGVIE